MRASRSLSRIDILHRVVDTCNGANPDAACH